MIRNIFTLLMFCAAIGIFVFYTKPTYDSVQALSAQGAQYDEALGKATELQSLKQTLLARYNSFDPNQLNRLSTLLPDQVDNIRLILDLDNLAGRFGMALQNVNISTPSTTQGTGVVGSIATGAQPYSSLVIQYTTHGTYEEFVQFLSSLESSLRLVDLQTLSVIADGNPTGPDPLYTYTMTVQTYWLR